MSFLDLAWNRKSVRNYKSDDVALEKIHKLLEAARAAPSGGNCQPWFFYVIRDTALTEKIYNLSCKQNFLTEAPVLIVVCADLARTAARYADRGKTLYSIQDTAAAIQNILLCATDEGLAACWCGAFDEKALAEILELKEDFRPVAIIPIGYAVNEQPKRSRRPLEEVTAFIGFDSEPILKTRPQRVKLEFNDMKGALFNNLNLKECEIENTKMTECTFNNVDLSYAEITECNLSNLVISNCATQGMTINGRSIAELTEEEDTEK